MVYLGCALLTFFIFVGEISQLRASISLGTCQLSCDQNEEELPYPGRGLPGIPGKRGQKGDTGPRGLTGPKGDPSMCCENLKEINKRLEREFEALKDRMFPKGCSDVNNHVTSSGIFVIFPFQNRDIGVQVYCDQDTDDGGGWIVIQRRMDGSEDFYRSWDDYVRGFGYNQREFWLGLETIHNISANQALEMRFDFITRDGEKLFAKYSTFRLSGPDDNYRITITGYSGNAGDSMAQHNNNQFSTKDRDNDRRSINCAIQYTGGWWYNSCHHANLNGLYGDTTSSKGLSWYRWKDSYVPFAKFIEMKIRKN